MDKIFVALYNPMIYESSFGIINIHKTRKGAEMAMEFHKKKLKKEWKNLHKTTEERKDIPFGEFQSWLVLEYELNPK